MLKNIVIFTSSELRHRAFRYFISNHQNIKVLRTYSEEGSVLKKNLEVGKNKNYEILLNHLKERDDCEKAFFLNYVNNKKDFSNSISCKNGFISSIDCLNEVKKLNPDLIVVYGSTIIKGDLLKLFRNKILNVHLGLSPYYRGSGTNYFPFVLNEPEYAGATFMYLDEGIDTGEIIHQIRPRIFEDDTFHMVGNRLIKDMFTIYGKLIEKFSKIKKVNIEFSKSKRLLFKNKDFTIETLVKLKENFKNKILKKYLKNKNVRDLNVPIIKQDWIKDVF